MLYMNRDALAVRKMKAGIVERKYGIFLFDYELRLYNKNLNKAECTLGEMRPGCL